MSEDMPAACATQPIRLPVLQNTSPSGSELMRVCMLQAGMSRAPGISDVVLGNPKAWLGTAYHEVLERVSREEGDPEIVINRLWNEAIERQYARSRAHPLDVRFGRPETWLGYHVTLATLRLRAQDLVGRAAREGGGARKRAVYREQRFVAAGGRLVGKPDLLLNRKIVDYKTGNVLEENADGDQSVRQGYVRQLRLYAYLVHENLGWWPSSAELVPLSGPVVSVDIDPADCAAEAANAVGLLERYNDLVTNSASPDALASPSPVACKWCRFKLLCNAFWTASSPEWSGQLDGEAISGPIIGAPRSIHSGMAVAITVDATAGTARGQVSLAPIPSNNAGLMQAIQGSVIRCASLYRRPDGSLTPTLRTLFIRNSDVPEIVAADV